MFDLISESSAILSLLRNLELSFKFFKEFLGNKDLSENKFKEIKNKVDKMVDKMELKDKTKLLYITSKPPICKKKDRYSLLTEKEKNISAERCLELMENEFPNDLHMIVEGVEDADFKGSSKDMPAVIKYSSIYYSELLAIEKQKRNFFILSTAALIFSNDDQSILLHKRSRQSKTYKGKFHIFGGACIANMRGNKVGHDENAEESIKREIKEELNMEIEDKDLKNVYVSIVTESESDTNLNFLQMAFLGINIPKDRNIEANWEGTITRVSFENLFKECFHPEKRKEFVPSALLQIYCWLLLDAPGATIKNKKILINQRKRIEEEYI